MAKVRKLLNFYEGATEVKVRRALEGTSFKVVPAVSLSEALQIDRNSLTPDQFEYALKTNFDLLVIDQDSTPAFAVEFDGVVHSRKGKIRNDKMKAEICRTYDFPILRIDETLLHSRVEKTEILGWLVEFYFLCEEFYAMQERGEIPADEPWYYGSLITFDPFLRVRALAQRWQSEGKILNGIPHYIVVEREDNSFYALSALEVSKGQWIIGEARCRDYYFHPIPPSELTEELSMVNAVNTVRDFLSGNQVTLVSDEELRSQLEQLRPQVYSEGGVPCP